MGCGVLSSGSLSYGDDSGHNKRHVGYECKANNASGHVQATEAVHSATLLGEGGTGHGGRSSISSPHAQ